VYGIMHMCASGCAREEGGEGSASGMKCVREFGCNQEEDRRNVGRRRGCAVWSFSVGVGGHVTHVGL
jgi:hypothetical protein